ncbi:amino acid adenylation domain-containing protein [Streptomyces sp. NPDC058239]|uniref:amino acid adenylation domain-containing protein n=1 Tax=unclassified Streptomyces TaxID=2593676 RepID=UPI0036590C3D
MTGIPEHYPTLPLAEGARERAVALALTRSEPYELGNGVHTYVERYAATHPDRTAIDDGEISIGYARLADRMHRTAARLAAAGISRGQIVAVGGRRGSDVITAFLALELLGAVYLPVDAGWPAARVESLLTDSGAVLMLTTGGAADSGELVKGAQAAGVPTAVPEPADTPYIRTAPPAPDEVRYVLYTSGSTGRPKAAIVEHQGMLNHLWAKVDDLGLTADDRLAQTAPLGFDISVWQMLAPLLVGGRVQIFGDEQAQDGALLLEELRSHGTTVLETVPTLIRFLLDAHKSAGTGTGALRWMIATGEELPPALARRWHKTMPGIGLLNAYGPTECSDDVTHALLGSQPAGVRHLPIGSPIGNAALYVLRSEEGEWHACAHGETGELFVGGLVVGRGYLGDPDTTARSFFTDPFGDGSGRLYRTGDAVRVLPDGQLEYLGRVDRQVKLGGVRMELAEIEAVLGGHPAIAACAVTVHTPDDTGALVARESAHIPVAQPPRLVAYVAASGDETAEESLRAHLAERLPAPMVPHTFVVLPHLPLTRNGKTDYKALPAPPRRSRPHSRPYTPPRGDAETAIAALVAQLLGTGRVGRDDSFLELGGDSLLAMRLVAALREEGSPAGLRDVLRDGSPAALAALGRHRQPAAGTRTEHAWDAPRTRPLTPQQAGVYFHWRLDPFSPYYSYQGSLELDGPLDVARLGRAWQLLLSENPLLLARFAETDEPGGQAVVHHYPHWEVPPPGQARHITADEFRTVAAEEAAKPFDLLTEPAMRTELFRLPGGQHRLLVTMHELLLDGWGATVLFQRLAELYEQQPAGPDPERATRYDRYLDHLEARLATEEVAEAGKYWLRRLAGDLPALQIAQKQRPATPTYRGETTEAVLDERLSQRLRDAALSASATAFVPLLAAYALALSYYGDADEVIVGAPMAGRERPEAAEVPAFMLAMLPLRLHIDPAATLAEFTTQVRETVYDAYAAADHPFGWTLRRLPAASRSSSATPVFQTMLNMLPYPARATTASDVGFRFVELDTGYTKYDCALYVQPHGPGRLLLQYAYQQELLDAPAARNVLESTLIALRALTDPERAEHTTIRSLDLLPGDDHR